jgi:hypothetical protein
MTATHSNKKAASIFRHPFFRNLSEGQAAEFWSKVDKTGECWIWTGIRACGYGVFSFAGVPMRAHRVAFGLATGVDPGEWHVLHSCDVPACVNPAHLRLGRDRDNVADKVARNRQAKGETLYWSKLTEVEVLQIREDYAAGRRNQYELSAVYGVSQAAINMILKRKTWKHI